jgi:hypothetical protein
MHLSEVMRHSRGLPADFARARGVDPDTVPALRAHFNPETG